MSNEVIGSAFHEEKNMKFIEKESDFVWQDSKTGKFGKGKNCPFQSGVLVAGMGDPVPDVKIAPKKAPAPKTKAVKPSENK
tara:strand:- start:414 stop:656 length:243 start_codon:yes stop_codon:yes gene_type:complete